MIAAQYFAMLSPVDLMGRMPSSIAQGLIWGIMALGVYITFRLLNIADLSVDGTFSTGAAITAMMIISGVSPIIALIVAFLSGILAGMVTGLLHTRLGIPAILAGILTQYGLYSINLAISVDKFNLVISGRDISAALVVGGIFAICVVVALYWFFGTEMGMALRATGCNSTASKAQGVNVGFMTVFGLALSNALVALAGGMAAQYSGFADVNSGRGAIVIGLAAVIIGEVIGEAILGKKLNFAGRLAFVVIGGIIYYIVYTIVLWLKIDSNLMKLFTAIIVAVFLAVPYLKGKTKNSFRAAKKNAIKGGE